MLLNSQIFYKIEAMADSIYSSEETNDSVIARRYTRHILFECRKAFNQVKGIFMSLHEFNTLIIGMFLKVINYLKLNKLIF